ncbi:MAG: hypothetical protein ACKVXR_17340 [Planctomycetota bacterium]
MKLTNPFAALAVVGSAFLLSSSVSFDELPEVGAPAPEIHGKAFLNSIGTEPSIASLRGQAVLLEFWFTT